MPREWKSHWDLRADCVKQAIEAIAQAAASERLLGFAHCGASQEGKLPAPLRSLADAISMPAYIYASALGGGSEAMTRLVSGRVPFYEALAPLELYVRGKNRYHDPIPEWFPLLEATEVCAHPQLVAFLVEFM